MRPLGVAPLLAVVGLGLAACAPLPPLERGLQLYDDGRYHALAIEDFTRAAALRPPFSRAIYNRGIARARAGDLAGAR